MSPIGPEIGKKQPFDLPEEEAYLNLLRTTAHLELAFRRLFKAHGLGESTYNVLRILRAAGAAGRCWTEIRDELVVPVPDVTRLIDRLESSELVERDRDAADARKVVCRITTRGRRLVDRLDAPVRDLHRELLGRLSRAELRTLIQLLERARGA